MAESTTPTWEAVFTWLMFIVTFDMVIVLLIIAPYQCNRLFVETGGEYACELGAGWYFFTALFSFLAFYLGYRFYKTYRILVALINRINGREKIDTPQIVQG